MFHLPIFSLARVAVVGIVSLLIPFCGKPWENTFPDQPWITQVSPNLIDISATPNQTIVHLSVAYANACKNLVIDGGNAGEGVTATLSGSPPYVVNSVVTLIVTVDPLARPGA